METTEYDVKSLTIGDNDISGIGDGTATGAITTLDTSIANIGTFTKVAENTTYELWVNNTTHCARIIGHRTDVTITNGNSFNGYSDFVIPTQYRPKNNIMSLIMRNPNFMFYLFSNGEYGIYNHGNTVTGYNISFQCDYTF